MSTKAIAIIDSLIKIYNDQTLYHNNQLIRHKKVTFTNESVPNKSIIDKICKPKRCRKKLKKQLNKYVLLPGIIYFDIIDTKHHKKAREMLCQTTETTKFVRSMNKQGKCLSIPIFLNLQSKRIKIQDKYLNQSIKILKKNSLNTYSGNIKNPNIYAIEFHIGTHGSTRNLRAFHPYHKNGTYCMSAGHFANNIHNIFVEYGLEHAIKSKDSVKFHFHVCNSAYCNINHRMNKRAIWKAVKEQTFIGKFWEKMYEFGYHNLIVIGYRGYYIHMKCKGRGNNHIIKVLNKERNTNRNRMSLQFDGKDAEFRVSYHGNVYLPRKCFFTVFF
eukprot:375720_1